MVKQSSQDLHPIYDLLRPRRDNSQPEPQNYHKFQTFVYNLVYYIIYSISTILSNILAGCLFLNPSEVPLVLDSLRSSSINLMNLLSASVSPLSQSVNARQFMKEITYSEGLVQLH